MSDIVERLRSHKVPQMHEAAAEIERLKAEVARARVREQELADEANRLLDEVKASDKRIFYLTAEVERKDAALDGIQQHNCGCVPICHCHDNVAALLAWKEWAVEEARAALTPSQEPRA
jgi:uncharacterized small protein (DUF1192 family)